MAVTPLLPSEPPQLVPRMMCFAGSCTRRTSLTRGSNSATAFTPASTVLPIPPHSWMESASGVLFVAVELHEVQLLVVDQVRRLHDLAAEADEDVRPDVRVPGEAGQRAVELLVVGPVVLHRAALAVHDGDDAVHVREVLEDARSRTRSAMYLLVLAEQFTVLMTAR